MPVTAWPRNMHLPKQQRHPVRGGALDDFSYQSNGARDISPFSRDCKGFLACAIPFLNRKNGYDDISQHPH